MEYLMSVMAHSSVTYVAKARPKCSGKNLEDEMKELGKLRTAIMMEKCQTRDEVIICPIPRKRNTGTIFLLRHPAFLVLHQSEQAIHSFEMLISVSQGCKRASQVPIIDKLAKDLDVPIVTPRKIS